ncbi:molybdopterin-guanine dinucleotide biosynthesis protein B [Heyndrickxia camelliae]|uniref:Molybdopterin-guanine dinucleotide biosynthesis protein B n=1 Tax=Heyndrickxia camelliae TaxID=1707093 RepID=A0A2N3LDR6_9BACI|nr:molybdopterin-guanine dinucleotide biosynthesis protein B [Heyndrickxia camelliae]PKR82751.1 molybdopterin-guanine dinucleotide biosynthesis protein B [Heyndrickxia camelliae]
MEGKTQIFQIVGYQNSGKTTIIQEITERAKKAGLKIGSIKHHGHSGTPTKESNEKDSEKHLQAGAVYAAVEGNGELIIKNQFNYWSLDEILDIYRHLSLDLILIEGYKHSQLPKAVIIRSKEDLPLLKELSNVQAVITWIPLTGTYEIPVFSIEQKSTFMEWLFHYLTIHIR